MRLCAVINSGLWLAQVSINKAVQQVKEVQDRLPSTSDRETEISASRQNGRLCTVRFLRYVSHVKERLRLNNATSRCFGLLHQSHGIHATGFVSYAPPIDHSLLPIHLTTPIYFPSQASKFCTLVNSWTRAKLG